MEKTVRIFNSHQEAEAADLAYFRSLTPEQRLRFCSSSLPITRAERVHLKADFKEFAELLNATGVEDVVADAVRLETI